MPINNEEFKAGKLHSKVEEKIISFLNERKEGAFTSQEIMGGIHYHTDFGARITLSSGANQEWQIMNCSFQMT